jgi:hypothetical protein
MKAVFINTSRNQFAAWRDHGAGEYINNDAYCFGGTDNSVVYNDVYKTSNDGVTWTQLANAPWSARNAMGTARGINKLFMFGGNDFVGAKTDSYEFDGVAWTQITALMVGWDRTMEFAFETVNGTTYVLGGGVNNVIKTTDYINWAIHSATIPADLQDSGGLSMCYYNGYFYIVTGEKTGGIFPGKLYRSATLNGDFEEIFTEDWLLTKWGFISALSTGLVITSGYDGTNNVSGSYYSTDGLTWKRSPYNPPATHAPCLIRKPDGSLIIVATMNDVEDSKTGIYVDVTVPV